MTRSRRAADVMRAVAGVACALALAAVASAAPKKEKTHDLVWTYPDLASLGIGSIAMLPVASYDNNLEAEKTVAQAVGMTFRESGHRWLSAATARELVRGDAVAESLFRVAREGVLKTGSVDSLLAPRLCAALRTNAVFAVRVDQWEQRKMEWNEAGKPSTTVQARAVLVDSTGRLVWSISGSETGEGAYHDPSTGAVNMSGGGLGHDPVNAQGGPPAYLEIVGKLFTRWASQFPSRAATAPASAAPKAP